MGGVLVSRAFGVSLIWLAAGCTRPAAPTALSGQASLVRTGDDRTAELRAATSGWRTDWSIHSVGYDELASGGVPRDGIPALDSPKAVSIAEAAGWLEAREPVIAVVAGGQARAYPLQILTWHEIANDELGSVPVAVTFCPLCNAAIAFDRRWQGRVLDFGVSGLLRNSDLVMWDRQTESLWQQLEGRAIAGELTDAQLTPLPALLLSWADFKQSYPTGTVLSRDTGYPRDYGANPYVGYDAVGQTPFLFQGSADGRLEAMERVVAVELDGETVAYPYDGLSRLKVVHDTVGGQPIVVFWKSGTASALDARAIAAGRDVGAAAVFRPEVDGRSLTFQPTPDGQFRDRETGSIWSIAGQAIAGPLAGSTLPPVVHANHFWFAWAAFKPETRVWGTQMTSPTPS